MKSHVFFITGVCGAGKSSLIPLFKNDLPTEKYVVHDFDERGVPTNADRSWRLEETKHWITVGKANAEKEVSTIICGFANPDEIKNISEAENTDIVFILLNANKETIHQRLEKRNSDPVVLANLERATGKTLETFIAENIAFAQTLCNICLENNCHVIETSHLNIPEVATKAIEIIQKV